MLHNVASIICIGIFTRPHVSKYYYLKFDIYSVFPFISSSSRLLSESPSPPPPPLNALKIHSRRSSCKGALFFSFSISLSSSGAYWWRMRGIVMKCRCVVSHSSIYLSTLISGFLLIVAVLPFIIFSLIPSSSSSLWPLFVNFWRWWLSSRGKTGCIYKITCSCIPAHFDASL